MYTLIFWVINIWGYDPLPLGMSCFSMHPPGENLMASIWSPATCIDAICCPLNAFSTTNRPTVVPTTTIFPSGSKDTDRHGFYKITWGFVFVDGVHGVQLPKCWRLVHCIYNRCRRTQILLKSMNSYHFALYVEFITDLLRNLTQSSIFGLKIASTVTCTSIASGAIAQWKRFCLCRFHKWNNFSQLTFKAYLVIQ